MADRWYAEAWVFPWPPESEKARDAVLAVVEEVGCRFLDADHPGFPDSGGMVGDFEGIPALHVFDDQATYGSTQFTESRLPEVCRRFGLADVITDEGDYEYAGEEHSWLPGEGEETLRSVLRGGETALPESTWRSWCASRTRDAADLCDHVDRYFTSPGRTVASENRRPR